MDTMLEFARGPLFRFSFAVMILGLLRVLVLSISGIIVALRRAGDRIVPWGDLTGKALGWIFPFGRLHRARPLYSLISFLFHIGLILVPIFYSAHVLLFEKSVGFSWGFHLPQQIAHYLTLLTIATAFILFLARVGISGIRLISRFEDFLWPVLLLFPFVTGYLCANVEMSAGTYSGLILIHFLSANFVMILIPFTKIAHIALMPVGQYVAGAAWKFPKGAGDRVMATLGRDKMREEVQP